MDDREVDPDTVVRWTRMKDKNGVKIFDGEILDVPNDLEKIGKVHKVYFSIKGIWMTKSLDRKNPITSDLFTRLQRGATSIGNIFDNSDKVRK